MPRAANVTDAARQTAEGPIDELAGILFGRA